MDPMICVRCKGPPKKSESVFFDDPTKPHDPKTNKRLKTCFTCRQKSKEKTAIANEVKRKQQKAIILAGKNAIATQKAKSQSEVVNDFTEDQSTTGSERGENEIREENWAPQPFSCARCVSEGLECSIRGPNISGKRLGKLTRPNIPTCKQCQRVNQRCLMSSAWNQVYEAAVLKRAAGWDENFDEDQPSDGNKRRRLDEQQQYQYEQLSSQLQRHTPSFYQGLSGSNEQQWPFPQQYVPIFMPRPSPVYEVPILPKARSLQPTYEHFSKSAEWQPSQSYTPLIPQTPTPSNTRSEAARYGGELHGESLTGPREQERYLLQGKISALMEQLHRLDEGQEKRGVVYGQQQLRAPVTRYENLDRHQEHQLRSQPQQMYSIMTGGSQNPSDYQRFLPQFQIDTPPDTPTSITTGVRNFGENQSLELVSSQNYEPLSTRERQNLSQNLQHINQHIEHHQHSQTPSSVSSIVPLESHNFPIEDTSLPIEKQCIPCQNSNMGNLCSAATPCVCCVLQGIPGHKCRSPIPNWSYQLSEEEMGAFGGEDIPDEALQELEESLERWQREQGQLTQQAPQQEAQQKTQEQENAGPISENRTSTGAITNNTQNQNSPISNTNNEHTNITSHQETPPETTILPNNTSTLEDTLKDIAQFAKDKGITIESAWEELSRIAQERGIFIREGIAKNVDGEESA